MRARAVVAGNGVVLVTRDRRRQVDRGDRRGQHHERDRRRLARRNRPERGCHDPVLDARRSPWLGVAEINETLPGTGDDRTHAGGIGEPEVLTDSV